MSYDVVIVGAGIAGLYCGIELQKKKQRTCILEKYGYTGGRVVTYRKEGYQWENGAGRISDSHTLVHSLLRKYALHTIPLGTDQLYIARGETEADAEPNLFESQFTAMLEQIKQLDPHLLATHTLEQIGKSILGEAQAEHLFSHFPYRAEVTAMRADAAMASFINGGEMGSYKGYTVCKEGLSSLIDNMVEEYKSLGGEVFVRHEMTELQQQKGFATVHCKVTEKESKDPIFRDVHGTSVILALHSAALMECPSTRHFPVLQHLTMRPLLRTYGVFPSRNGHSWFSGLPRVVTGDPIRYFIPIDPSRGIAMVSYTDDDDTKAWMKILDSKGETVLGQRILASLRSMFPSRKIPDYTFFKSHPWTYGCTYWKPGSYSIEEESRKAHHPDSKTMPSVYLCGESFSTRQAWMEGALEHAKSLLQNHF